MAKKVRARMLAEDIKRDEGLEIPEDVVLYDNISYGPYGSANLLSVSKPSGVSGKLPCIVNFHGGGFFYGSKETYQFYCASLAQRGFAVISFNYRLSPEVKFPAPAKDSTRMLEWMTDNADEYGIDTENVFFVGDSAGAHLAVQISAMMTNPEYARLFKFRVPGGFKLRAIATNCGMYDVLRLDIRLLKLTMLAYAPLKYIFRSKKLDVMRYVNKGFPPCFIASASHDMLLSYAAPWEKLLRQQGVETVCKIYGDKDDESAGHVFHVNIRLDIAGKCNDDECGFFRKHIVSA